MDYCFDSLSKVGTVLFTVPAQTLEKETELQTGHFEVMENLKR